MNWPSAWDGELRKIMPEIMTVTPGIGQTRMLGVLHSKGMRLQRWKVRERMREQDPVGTALRWRNWICPLETSSFAWPLVPVYSLLHWWVGTFTILNFFYTNDEMIGMNLSGANGKPHPVKHILGAIICTVCQADFKIVDYYSSFIHVP